jgi:CRP-like cAMP-binding protein
MFKSKERASTVLSDIRNICNHCAATRQQEDLRILHDFVSLNTEIVHDPFWKLLPEAQRIRLCAYFRHVRHEGDTLIYLDGSKAELKLLVWGEAELACGHHTFPLNARNKGPSLGGIQVPVSVQRLIRQTSPNYNTFEEPGKTCYDFMKRTMVSSSDPNLARPSVLMSKGSHCLYLNSLDLCPFMETLFDRLISHRIFNHLHLNTLRKRAQFYTIPRGHPIFMEGAVSNNIVLTLRGRCELRKSLASIKRENPEILSNDITPSRNANKEESIHIGNAPPMSFLGFLQHFNETECENIPHPMTIIAETQVRCLVLDTDEFMSCLKEVPIIRQIFRDIAEKQLKWLNHYLPSKLAMQLSQEEEIDPFPNSSMAELETLIADALTKKPLLNKHRVLNKFKTLVCGEDETEADPFSQFDFSGLSMSKLQKDIEADWGDGETDFLNPYPAIANRKYHGRSIPLVKQSDGFKNPFEM